MGQARRKTEPTKTSPRVQIEVSYHQIRDAFDSLRLLASGRIVGDTGPVRLSFATILKAKRVLGTLRPLVEQSNELLRDLQAKYGWEDDRGEFSDEKDQKKFEADAGTLLKTRLPIDCEQFSESDFSEVSSAPSVLIGILDSLGPFWRDE